MNQAKLVELRSCLEQDEDSGFDYFRTLYFDALDKCQFDDCQMLLDVLAQAPPLQLQQASRHYRAVVLLEQHRYDQAEVMLRELLAEELSPVQKARSLLELATALDEQGQWPEAQYGYHEALQAYEQVDNVSSRVVGQLKAYNNLGISICFQIEQEASDPSRIEEAIFYHRQAIKLAQANEDAWEEAKNRHGLAKAYALMGRYEKAVDEFQAYLDACVEENNRNARGYTLVDLAARVYMPQEQWTEAAVALDEAIPLLQETQDDLNLAEALTFQGNLLVKQGQPEQALVAYEEALACVESIRMRLTAPTAQARYRATAEAIYTAPLALHLRQNNAAAAFDIAERARSRGLADLLANQQVQPHVDLPAHLLEQHEALRQRLDQVSTNEFTPAEVGELERSLAEIEHQIELLDPAYATLRSATPLTATEVQAWLPPNSVLLSFAGDANDRLWILTVTSDDVHATAVPRITVRWLQGYLADHLDGIRRGSLVPDPDSGYLASTRLFADLYKVLLEPVADLLNNVNTVYIVPFGPLHYLPLGALAPSLHHAPPLLSPGRRVVYAPSATILFNYCHTRSPSSKEGILALAPQDRRLQFTHGAAQTIAHRGGGSSVVGSAATRQALLSQAGNYRMVSFLGHAIFDRRYPMSSRLQLADGNLYAGEILRELRLQADLVILGACETGRGHVLRGDEFLGLTRSMLYAGTPSLLVTLWLVHEIATRLLLEKFVAQLLPHGSTKTVFDPVSALTTAQTWLRTLTYAEACEFMADWEGVSAADAEKHLTALWQMTHPGQAPHAESQLFAHPFFWSPYILIGDHPSFQVPKNA